MLHRHAAFAVFLLLSVCLWRCTEETDPGSTQDPQGEITGCLVDSADTAALPDAYVHVIAGGGSLGDVITDSWGCFLVDNNLLGNAASVSLELLARGYHVRRLSGVFPPADVGTTQLSPYSLDSVPLATIFITSIPPVASIVYDNMCVGLTNVDVITVPAGDVTLRFHKSLIDTPFTLSLVEGENPSRLLTLSYQ